MAEALEGTERQGGDLEEPAVSGTSAADPSTSEPQNARTLLRKRWELASVLNFLHVFEPVIRGKLGASAEDIEDALITPNELLSKLHVTLLQGIPPVSRNVGVPDAWITLVCKQLALWWTWVAEGEIPLVANRGAEIQIYKELDPVTRLLILKAICEIRAEQDDIIHYIDETLKNGSSLATFRKDKIGGANGTTYWYDGDSVIGHRLYKENILGSHKQKVKGKGCLVEPTITYQWETLACDLEEFQNISDILSDSKISGESSVGGVLKADILPVVEKMQKKKERLLKRQQREVLLLSGFCAADIGSRRSCRDRKPVTYTYDEYDRSIKEAIEIELKRQPIAKSRTAHDRDHSTSLDDSFPVKKENANWTDDDYGNDNGEKSASADDADYNEQSDGDTGDDNNGNTSSDEDTSVGSDMHAGSKHARHEAEGRNVLRLKICKTGVEGLRRSARHTCGSEYDSSLGAQGMGHAEMKKRLRQRPTPNSDFPPADSEDETGTD